MSIDFLWACTCQVCSFCYIQRRDCSFVACLTSQQQASVSHGRICSDNCTCCHTEASCRSNVLSHPVTQYTDTETTSPSADPITQGVWQGSHWSINFQVTGMTRPRKSRRKWESNPLSPALEAPRRPGVRFPLAPGFFRSSHTSDLKTGIPAATLPDAWRYRVSAGTGRSGVIICDWVR